MTNQTVLTQSTMSKRHQRAPARPDQLAYTIPQVQEVGGPGRTKVYQLVNQGKLKLVRVGGRSRITGASLRALLGGEDAGMALTESSIS